MYAAWFDCGGELYEVLGGNPDFITPTSILEFVTLEFITPTSILELAFLKNGLAELARVS